MNRPSCGRQCLRARRYPSAQVTLPWFGQFGGPHRRDEQMRGEFLGERHGVRGGEEVHLNAGVRRAAAADDPQWTAGHGGRCGEEWEVGQGAVDVGAHADRLADVRVTQGADGQVGWCGHGLTPGTCLGEHRFPHHRTCAVVKGCSAVGFQVRRRSGRTGRDGQARERRGPVRAAPGSEEVNLGVRAVLIHP